MLASSREPCGGVRFPGRAMALPYKPSEYARPKGNGCHPPGVRRAGCPHPAEARGGTNVSILNRQCAVGVNARPTERGKCGGQPEKNALSARLAPGGYGIRPYGRRRIPRPTGKPRSRRTANLCRGRCLHRPADPASPQGPGRDKSRPYKPSEMPRQTGTGCNHPGDRRAGCPHPAAPCGGANAPGGINPAPTNLPK